MVQVPTIVQPVEEIPIKVPFLYGTHMLSLDAKNRISVPAEIRSRLDPKMYGEALFVIVKDGIPRFFPERYYEWLTNSQMPPGIQQSKDSASYFMANFAMAQNIPIDTQGRITLPADLIRRAKLGKEFAMIGMRDHLQLWNRDAWLSMSRELDKESNNIIDDSNSSNEPKTSQN